MEVTADILALIVSHLDNSAIQLLSLVPGIWEEVYKLASKEQFWYLRVQNLVGRSLLWRSGSWKEAYYILSRSTTDILNDEDNALAASVVLELGADPTSMNNRAIKNAASTRINIVKLLLTHPRVDPTVDNNFPIQSASGRGCTEIVRIFLTDKRVDPTDNDSYSLQYACAYEQTEVVRLLLEDGRVDPACDDNRVIRQASRDGYTEIVKILLADPRVDPSAEQNRAIKNASQYGRIEVVKLLLADPRVDASDEDNYALRMARNKRHLEVIELLEQHLKR